MEETMSETTTNTEPNTDVSETSADTEATATEATETAAPEVRDPAKLLNAYEAEKSKRKEQDAALRELRTELDAIKAKAEGKEAEFAAAQEAQRLKDEYLAKANERIVGAELRAAAKGRVNEDVLNDLALFIKPSDFEVGDDGSIDTDAIAKAIDDLITKRPSFAAQGGKKFQGGVDGGARNDASKLTQLTRGDLSRMTPEQIVAADESGQLDALRSGN